MSSAATFQRLIANLGAATVARIVCAVLSMGQFWWLSHTLSLSELGGFALVMGFYALLQGLPLLGLHVPLTREVATLDGDLGARLRQHRHFALPVAALLAAGLTAYGYWVLQPALMPALVLVALALLPTAVTLVAESALIGQERVRVVALLSVVEAIWRWLGSIGVVALGFGLTGVAAVFLLGRCGAAAMVTFWSGLPRGRRSGPIAATRRPMWAQVPVYLGIVAVAAVSTRLDLLALAQRVSLDAVASYAVAAKLYEAALMLPTLAALVVLPPLARQFIDDRAGFVANVPRVVSAMLGWGLPLVLIGVGLMPALIDLAFAKSLHDAAPIAQVLLFAALLAALDMMLASWMQAAHAQKADLHCLSWALLVMVIVLLVAVPAVGALGAAFAMLALMATRVVLRARWARRTLGIGGLGALLGRAALAATLAVAVLIGWPHWQVGLPTPLFAIAMALLAYGLAALVLGLLAPRRLVAALRTALPRSA